MVLIRAMRDSNLPKFLSEDAELFEAIVSDLFPGVEVPEVEQGDLARAIIESLEEHELQNVDKFVLKVVQMYETFNVRFGAISWWAPHRGRQDHGVPDAAVGAHEAAAPRNGHENENFQIIHTHVFNPGRIKMGELYGEYNLSRPTSGRRQGAQAHLRIFVADATLDKKWVVFDGPVDAIWIENMNTVLDDNRRYRRAAQTRAHQAQPGNDGTRCRGLHPAGHPLHRVRAAWYVPLRVSACSAWP